MSIPGHCQQFICQPGSRRQSRISQPDRVLPDPWLRIVQGFLNQSGIQLAQAFQSPQSVNPRLGPAAAGGDLLQTIDCPCALTAHQ